MTDKPKLVTLETRATEVTADVIETLERLIEQARSGKVRGIAYAVVRPNGDVNVDWSATEDRPALMGAVALLQFDLCETMTRVKDCDC